MARKSGVTTAPLSAAWQANTFFAQFQLVFNASILYVCNTAHISRSTFDATEATSFTQVVASGGGGVGSLAVTSVSAMGASQTINQGGVTTLIWDGTLSQATCAFNKPTGWPNAGTYGEILVRVHQDGVTPGRKLTIPGVDLWSGIYAPVQPSVTSGTLEFTMFSIDGGTTVVGIHGQPIRTHTLRILAPSDGVAPKDLEYFNNDARIVKVRMSTGGTPVSTPAVFDVFKGAGNGAASTIYSTTGNRPSVSAGNLTNSAVALPDTVDIAPGDYLQGKTITTSSSTNAAIQITTVETA